MKEVNLEYLNGSRTPDSSMKGIRVTDSEGNEYPSMKVACRSVPSIEQGKMLRALKGKAFYKSVSGVEYTTSSRGLGDSVSKAMQQPKYSIGDVVLCVVCAQQRRATIAYRWHDEREAYIYAVEFVAVHDCVTVRHRTEVGEQAISEVLTAAPAYDGQGYERMTTLCEYECKDKRLMHDSVEKKGKHWRRAITCEGHA